MKHSIVCLMEMKKHRWEKVSTPQHLPLYFLIHDDVREYDVLFMVVFIISKHIHMHNNYSIIK
jgi:hypothetical protein